MTTSITSSADPSLPSIAWRRRYDDLPDMSRFKPAMPSFWESMTLIPLALRMSSYVTKEKEEGRDPIFDLNGTWLQPPIPGPYSGVPLGGIGGGCIGRGFRGEFRRWNLTPGKYSHKVVHADQFSVRIKRGDKVFTQVLSVEDGSASEALKTWKWSMPASKATYHALYPRAWTVYEEAVPLIRLTCRQVSPVIPHDYIDSSLPAAVFVWTIENLGIGPAEVSIMFTFQNGTGGPNDKAGGHHNKAFVMREGDAPPVAMGVQLHHYQRQTGVSLAKATSVADGVGPEPMVMQREGSWSRKGGRAAKGLNFSSCVCNVCKGFDAEDDIGCCLGDGGGRQGEGRSTDDLLTFAVAAEVKEGSDVGVSVWSQFQTSSPGGDTGSSAKELWAQFTKDGELKDPTLKPDWWLEAEALKIEAGRVNGAGYHIRDDGERVVQATGLATKSSAVEAIAAAVCQKVVVPGHGKRTMSFALSWDMPVVRFGGGLGLPRRYTRFFGKEGKAAAPLATYALRTYKHWEEQIDAWQRPILKDPKLPIFYKHMLFNELYYLTDGGTIWTDSKGGLGNCRGPIVKTEAELAYEEEDVNNLYRNCHGEQDLIGQFMYLEGHEYLMYNTYDVHFYASFALSMLWPMLELSVQQDVASAVMSEDLTIRRLIARGEPRPRKVYGSVPHDLGCPSGMPWTEVNSYNLQDVNRWKDLGPKLVLQIYRDYIMTSSKKFLENMWPVIIHVMQTTQEFDTDGDGLIENSGFPDQTYDIWTVEGPSAYTGGLWVAALTAVAAIGEILGDDVHTKQYQLLTERARAAYIKRLWNGKYFDYDASASFHHDSIMADQMAGQWYTRACGLPPVVDPAMARSSLSTVFQFNVQSFADGLSGAVNGMRPDGSIDNTCMQSKEVWTGTTYSVAAAMLQEAVWAEEESEGNERALHLKEEAAFLRHAAFETARGLYEAGWNRLGYWFCTPEAWDQHGYYRSLGYMRPLCIWAMQWALSPPVPTAAATIDDENAVPIPLIVIPDPTEPPAEEVIDIEVAASVTHANKRKAQKKGEAAPNTTTTRPKAQAIF